MARRGVREFRVSADLAHQRTNLIATGWDVTSKQAARYEADEAAIRAELNDGDSGMTTLLSAFGKRPDTLAHGLPCISSEARTLAEASLRHLARRFVVGQGIAETQIALRVGAKIKLSGMEPLLEGEYTLTFIDQCFDK